MVSGFLAETVGSGDTEVEVKVVLGVTEAMGMGKGAQKKRGAPRRGPEKYQHLRGGWSKKMIEKLGRKSRESEPSRCDET